MSTATLLEPTGSVAPPFLDDDPLYEVIDGQRVEMPPMSAFAARIASRLLRKLGSYAEEHDQGEAVCEVLFRLHPLNRNRRPDGAFVSYDRWPKGQPMNGGNAWEVVPNLAIEVISPSDFFEDQLEKVEEYFQAGVELVWVVSPLRRIVHVYESYTQIRVLTASDELDGGSVVPGFRLPLAELFGEFPAKP